MMPNSPILVATFSRPHFLLVERATRNQGIAVSQVEPTLEALSPCLADDSDSVVVVDALQQASKALAFCKGVKAKYPKACILVLGGSADVGAVARAVIAGASNYFLPHTPLDELIALLADAVANKPAGRESLFGRVLSAIPSPPDKEGLCRNCDGQQYPLHEAITQCQALGLEPEVIAEHLKVPADKLEAILEKAQKAAPRQSLLGRVLSSLPDAGDLEMPAGEASSLKPLVSVFVLLLCIFIGWRLFAGGTASHEVTGSVTFQGKPLKCGLIRFIPEGSSESPRPIVSGEIRDGRYRLQSSHGSDGGTYRVVVSGFTGLPKQAGPVMDPLGDQLFPDIKRSASLPCSDAVVDLVCDSPTPQTQTP